MRNNVELGLKWTVEPGDRSTVVHISGEIDLGTHEDFADAARAGLRTPAPVVVVDLARVTYLGSVGLRVLTRANDEARQAGRMVRVVDGSAIVHRIMEVCGLEQVLSLYPTVADARSA
ncbi:MAG: STAS domain-containing protein [Kibdelosporangium sp.]